MLLFKGSPWTGCQWFVHHALNESCKFLLFPTKSLKKITSYKETEGQNILSLHDRRFMSQAGRTWYFARSARREEEKIKALVSSSYCSCCSALAEQQEQWTANRRFIFPSSRAWRSCRAPLEISRSPRLAHKAPVMQPKTYCTHLTRKSKAYWLRW